MKKISELLDSVNLNRYREVFVTGDFNFDILNVHMNNDSSRFLNLMYSHSLLPIITKPTRITDSSSTLLDNIFIRNPVLYDGGIMISDYSDHFPVFILSLIHI